MLVQGPLFLKGKIKVRQPWPDDIISRSISKHVRGGRCSRREREGGFVEPLRRCLRAAVWVTGDVWTLYIIPIHCADIRHVHAGGCAQVDRKRSATLNREVSTCPATSRRAMQPAI